jgi:DNA-binding transcriptional regulator YiaG
VGHIAVIVDLPQPILDPRPAPGTGPDEAPQPPERLPQPLHVVSRVVMGRQHRRAPAERGRTRAGPGFGETNRVEPEACMAALKGLDDSIKVLAQRNIVRARRAMSETKQATVAALLGVSESTLSDWLTDQLDRSMQTIAAAGLKVVDREDLTVSQAEIAAYRHFARKGMEADCVSSDFGDLT